MSDKYLNETGLTYYHDRVKPIFENKIEKIKVNGTEETITNKEVDLEVPTVVTSAPRDETDSVVSILNNIANDQSGVEFSAGDDTVGFILKNKVGTVTQNKSLATTDYVNDNGGKIDKIKVNGVEQTITNKEVNLQTMQTDYGEGSFGYYYLITDEVGNSFYRFETTAAGYLAGFAQGSGTSFAVSKELVDKTYVDDTFRTEAQVQTAIDDALADITGMDFVLVDTLPATGEKGKIYLVPNGSTGSNIKDEYIWLTPESATPYFEKIGSTDIDLSGYWAKTELVAITTAEIDAIVAGN